jgi:hypothetical protein
MPKADLIGRNAFHTGREDGSGDIAVGIYRSTRLRPASLGNRQMASESAAFARSFSVGDRLMCGGMSDHDPVPLRRYDPSGRFSR